MRISLSHKKFIIEQLMEVRRQTMSISNKQKYQWETLPMQQNNYGIVIVQQRMHITRAENAYSPSDVQNVLSSRASLFKEYSLLESLWGSFFVYLSSDYAVFSTRCRSYSQTDDPYSPEKWKILTGEIKYYQSSHWFFQAKCLSRARNFFSKMSWRRPLFIWLGPQYQ